MPDVYLTIAQAPEALQHQLADVLEVRAADAQQQAMLESYLAELPLAGARVLEIGCGTGAICRRLARDAAEVTGIDPSPVFVERARALAPGIRFEVADGQALPFADDSFDVAIFHTVLCHVPDPEAALREARRVARHLGVFDGDYATTTVAIGENDPLQACAEATVAGLVHDRWLVRRLAALIEATGWTLTRQAGHSYTETRDPVYGLTIVDRGAGLLAASGTIGEETAEALKAEARRRVAAGTYYAHIDYASFLASASV
jgi:ubiquinone/menaquinone biosynthesis C-methylase UbiE